MRSRNAHPRLALIGITAVLGAVLAVPPAYAGQPNSVDPALMQPPLNPAFAPWECWRTGNGITCEGSRTNAYDGLEVDFLACAVGPVYSQGAITTTARRVGNADGLALETTFRDRYEETFSIDPEGSDPTLQSIGRLQHSFAYGTPGDPSTVSETLAGMGISVTGPGFGVVLHDVGTVAWDSDGEILRFGGVHPPAFSPEEWQAAHDRICAFFESAA